MSDSAPAAATIDPYLIVTLKSGWTVHLQLPDAPTDVDSLMEHVVQIVGGFRTAGAICGLPTRYWRSVSIAQAVAIPWDSVDFIEAVW